MSFQKEAAVYVLLSAIFSLFDEGKPFKFEPSRSGACRDTTRIYSPRGIFIFSSISDFHVLAPGVESRVLKRYEMWKSAIRGI